MRNHKIVFKYLKYKIFASHKRGHGIHSPFVFSLITEVFRNKIDPDIVCNIEKLRKKMLADQSLVNVTDYGAGSKHIKDKLRKVSSIARYSSVPAKYGKLLANLAGRYGGTDIVELGTSLGISTLYLSKGSASSTVHTIEGCPVLSDIAGNYFREAGCSNIKSYTGKFDEVLSELKNRNIVPGLVFIDGDHRREALLRYFDLVAGMCNDKSVVVIDDIHSSAEMFETWEEIKNLKNVTVTIDIFRLGIVFFRKGIAKSDYVIRY